MRVSVPKILTDGVETFVVSQLPPELQEEIYDMVCEKVPVGQQAAVVSMLMDSVRHRDFAVDGCDCSRCEACRKREQETEIAIQADERHKKFVRHMRLLRGTYGTAA